MKDCLEEYYTAEETNEGGYEKLASASAYRSFEVINGIIMGFALDNLASESIA